MFAAIPPIPTEIRASLEAVLGTRAVALALSIGGNKREETEMNTPLTRHIIVFRSACIVVDPKRIDLC
jgi:hypothetical protein